MTETLTKVLEKIPKGKEKAVSRKTLAELTGYSDRNIRDSIAQLRDLGYPICNFQDGRGYFLSDDMQDIKHQYEQERKRALQILKQLKIMRRMIKKAEEVA